jgi:RimJ/RimL family protein N-acetyltransferase
MPSFTPITLTTQRLTLRFLNEDDTPAIFAIYSHPEVMRYWSTPPWTEIEQARQWVADCLHCYQTGEALQLAVARNQDRALLGVCSLFSFHAASRRAEIGYAMERAFWGQGYMHEALSALIEYAFTTLNLNRIEADIDLRNQASAKTLARLGFQKEGHARQRWIVNDEISDTWWYGLLRQEWRLEN